MAALQQSAYDLPPGLIEKNIILHIQACQDRENLLVIMHNIRQDF